MIWNARRVRFGHDQRKNYFYFEIAERLRTLRYLIFTGGYLRIRQRLPL